MQRSKPTSAPVRLSLALQGGGAHGAFTWGVLDRLLEDDRFVIAAISGTSSGAMNAMALAQGFAENGAAGARQRLSRFWTELAERHALPAWWFATTQWMFGGAMPWTSLPPLASNPLREAVAEFDVEAIRRGGIDVYVAATRVADGRLALFHGESLTHDAVLASACLPQLFPAVRIDGHDHWDGVFAGNPVLEPLLPPRYPADILCVLVHPLVNDDADTVSPGAIDEHMQSLSFASAFRRELRDLARVRHAVRRRWWMRGAPRRLCALRFHVLQPRHDLAREARLSRLDVRLGVLTQLRDCGRDAAQRWLGEHGDAIGRRGSFDDGAWIDGLGA